MKHALINGLNISYTERHSEEKSTLLFIHGNSHAENSFEWQASSEALKNFRLIFINLPGHGLSESSLDYSLPMYAEVVSKLVSELKIENVILVGHSLGGHVAISALNFFKPAGLFIYGTPPLVKPLDMSVFLPNQGARALGMEVCTAEDLEDFLTTLNYTGREKSKAEENFKKTDPRARTSVLASIGANNYFDECELLKKYDGKLMVLVCQHENIVNNNYIAKAIATARPDASTVTIEAGHVPHVEKHEEFNKMLAEFSLGLFNEINLNRVTQQNIEVPFNMR